MTDYKTKLQSLERKIKNRLDNDDDGFIEDLEMKQCDLITEHHLSLIDFWIIVSKEMHENMREFYRPLVLQDYLENKENYDSK